MAARRARSNGGDIRRALRARLEARRSEIEATALTRIATIADPSEIADPAYAEGLRRALPAAIGFGIETIDAGESRELSIPVDLLAQARLAARNRISLDTVLRRYFAGYSLLGYFILEEAAHARITDGAELQRFVAAQSAHFDRLLAAVAEEHERETESLAMSTSERRRAERIERLLAGEPVDTREIGYEFHGRQLCIVAAGLDRRRSLRDVAESFDSRLLFVRPEPDTVWAWLGGSYRLDPDRLLPALTREPPARAVAIGEPGDGLEGWRLSHRQALAALPVALRGPRSFVRYADVALQAASIRDDVLARSLRSLYIEPLEQGHGGAEVLRQTLRAYFDAGRAVSSAAAVLGVKRHTVTSRLRTVEERIGRTIDRCGAELEVALRLEELGA